MTKDEFEGALRRWGWVYGERPDGGELPENVKAPAVHPIARAMEFGHRSIDRSLGAAYQRRLRDGEKSWSRDPISCRETRQSGSSAPKEGPKHDMATVIQAEWLELGRNDSDLAEVLRLEYHVREQQADKAKRFGVGRNKFREMLAEAKGWMYARLDHKAAA